MRTLRKIVLATGNPGKLQEIKALFADLDTEVVAQADLQIESPEETGQTFVENALLKARHAADASGLPAVADDSGIAVDALGGRPGVYSARYAGINASDEQNLLQLLEDMVDIAEDDRGAGFHCAAVLAFPEDAYEPVIAEGIWRGRILHQPVGEGGFGYDPVFLDEEKGKTGAQMSREEKNSLSHRGIAFRELRRLVQERLS